MPKCSSNIKKEDTSGRTSSLYMRLTAGLLLRLLLSNQSCCRRCCRQKNRSAGDWNLQWRRRRALALATDSPSAAANAAVMRSSTILVRLRPHCRFIGPDTAWMDVCA